MTELGPDAASATESSMDAQFRSSDSPDDKAIARALREEIGRHYDEVIGSVREFASAMIKLREPADLDETKKRAARFAAAAILLRFTAQRAGDAACSAIAEFALAKSDANPTARPL